MVDMIGAEFNDVELGCTNWSNTKPVSPDANRLITTPSTTWSTRYLMANRARSAAVTTDASTAANRAAGIDWVTEPTTAAANAAFRNWPSMATFTTPARSPITPASEPRTNGVARARVPASWLLTGNGSELLAAAQLRKPSTSESPATAPANRRNGRDNLPEIKPAPATRQSRAVARTTGPAGRAIVGSWTVSNAFESAKFAVGPELGNKPIRNTPITRISTEVDRRARRASGGSR